MRKKGITHLGLISLSSGYAAVLDIIVDLIMRMEKNADKTFRFLQPGIVLIDKDETHFTSRNAEKYFGTFNNAIS